MEQEQNKESAVESKKKKNTGKFMEGLTTAFAAPVYLHDAVQARIDDFLIGIGRSIATEFHNARIRYKHGSGQIMQSFLVIAIVTCAMLLIFEHNTVYEYSYNGRVLGYVKAQDTVVELLDVAGERLSETNDFNIEFQANENVTFRKVSSNKRDTDSSDQVLNKLTYMTDIEVTATGIYLDGELVAIVENPTMATNVLNSVKLNYNSPDPGMTVQSIEIEGDITTNPVDVMLTGISSRSKAAKTLIKGGKLSIQHMVKEGETIESIAETYGVPADAIRRRESDIPVSFVTPGEVVVVSTKIDPLTVIMEEYGTKAEVLRHETKEVKTDDLYIGDTEVEQAGVDGRQIITGTIIKKNGEEVGRDIEETEMVKEPVTEIILIGTSETPVARATGSFAFPLHDSYTWTAYFGPRWGSFHKGIDLACPTGTPIYAADGGMVTRAEWFTGYGNCIDIEHKDGTYSRYGHLSAYAVSAGDAVYKGQVIGYVGSTGFSTGPHLHFEIHPNGGDPVDPAPYIGLS